MLAVSLLPLALNPFAPDPFETGKVILFRAITLAMLGGTLLSSWGQRRLQRPTHSEGSRLANLSRAWQQINLPAAPLIAYVAAYLLATGVSIDPKLSLWGSGDGHGTVTTLLHVLFFLLLTAALVSWHDIDRIIAIMIASSVPVAFYGWIQYLGLDALSWVTLSISPVHSTLGRSVFLGAYLAMVIPFTLARILRTENKRRIAHILILLLQIGCLSFTLARGAWLGLVVATLLFFGMLTYHRRVWLLGAGAIVLVGLAVFVFIAWYGEAIIPDEVDAVPGERFVDRRLGSNSSRVVTWGDALTLIPKRWLLGYGPESYATAVDQADLVSRSSEPAWMHQNDPHNLFLYHFTAVGVVGFLSFLWLIERYLSLLFNRIRHTTDVDNKITMTAVLCSTTAYLVQAQFNPDVITLTVLYWVSLALGFAVARLDHARSNALT
jgi:O-antigen ligase